jgi:hypothetical protein
LTKSCNPFLIGFDEVTIFFVTNYYYWLVSDLGKILLLPKFGELPQWAVVG